MKYNHKKILPFSLNMNGPLRALCEVKKGAVEEKTLCDFAICRLFKKKKKKKKADP